MKTTLVQAFTENMGGITKGSMNRIIAFLCAITIFFIAIYCTVTGKDLPLALIAQLITFSLTLLGFSMVSKNVDRNAPPRPISGI